MRGWKAERPRTQQQLQHLLARQCPVVVMGRGHSGTRMLSWVCSQLGINLGTRAQLPTGDTADHRFTQAIKRTACHSLDAQPGGTLQARALRRFQKAVYGYYVRLGAPPGEWGWKFPETYLIAPYVAATFPRARYIHLLRDGRDIAFKRHLTDDPKRRLGKKLLRSQRALAQPHHIQAAISWAFQVERFEQFRQSCQAARIFDVKFEELCVRPEEVLQDLCTFLQLAWPQACDMALREYVETQKVAQYTAYDPALVREVERQIGVTLRRYAYL